MKTRHLFTLVVLVVLVGGGLFYAGQSLRQTMREEKLLIHCGSSMRPAAEEIAREYQQRYGTTVEFNFGGSETLLPAIELSHEGDIFLCHDPFAAELKKKGLLERAVTVGYLEPRIIVPKGNPKGIHSLADLAKPKLRVGNTDPRFATCGAMVEKKLAERGLTEAVMKNVVLQTRGHTDLATALIAGQLDAAIVWNFTTASFADKVDCIPTGETFPATRVTMCLLSCSTRKPAADRFLQLSASEFGRQAFLRHGYVREADMAPGGTH